MPTDDRDRVAGEQEDGELRELDRLIGSILNALKGRGTECSWERRCYYDALAAFGRMPRLAQLLQGRREAEARLRIEQNLHKLATEAGKGWFEASQKAEEEATALRRKVGELHEWGNQGWAQLASANAESKRRITLWLEAMEQLRAANARVEELEGLLRAWMATSDLAKDVTFVPIYKRTEVVLPEARETEPAELRTIDRDENAPIETEPKR